MKFGLPNPEKLADAYKDIAEAMNKHGGYTFETGRVLEHIIATIIVLEGKKHGAGTAKDVRNAVISNIDAYVVALINEQSLL